MSLVPSEARLSLMGSGNFTFEVGKDDDLVSWNWLLFDAHDQLVPFYEAGREPKGFVGFTWRPTISTNTRQFICPSDPTHGKITIKASGYYKDKDGVTKPTPDSKATLTFSAVWGGMMKARYPFPSNAILPWNGDPKGERALVLMIDLINQLPEEFRSAAGSIPIMRAEKSPNYAGFHPPYIADSIVITNEYIDYLTPGSPVLTDGDMLFTYTVLHEMMHAVTYQRASVNVHGVMVKANAALRNPPVVGWLGGYPISYGMSGLLALAHVLIFSDFVSGYAHVTRWELTKWYFKVARALTGVYLVIDLIYWLAHLHETRALPGVNPNIITGWHVIGGPFGLTNNYFKPGDFKQLQNDEWMAWELLQSAEIAILDAVTDGKPQDEIDRLVKIRDEVERDWKAKRQKMRDALAGSGVVSQYAAVDVLEDIAETVSVIVFGAERLNAMRVKVTRDVDPAIPPREAYVFLSHTDAGNMTDGFATRRKFLVEDAGLFPKGWDTTIEPGRFMRGQEKFDQLHEWHVEF